MVVRAGVGVGRVYSGVCVLCVHMALMLWAVGWIALVFLKSFVLAAIRFVAAV